MLREAVVVKPPDYDLVATAADTHRQIKDYEQALELYKRAAELKPDLPAAQMNLGAMYHLVGDFEPAKEYYLKTLELAPNDESTLENLRKLQNIGKQSSV